MTRVLTEQKQPAAHFIDQAIDPYTEPTGQQCRWTSEIQHTSAKWMLAEDAMHSFSV